MSSSTITTRPILFSSPMILALLEGRKTQTRRVVKIPHWAGECWADAGIGGGGYLKAAKPNNGTIQRIRCPYGMIGDLLWVRENFVIECTRDYHEMVIDNPPTDRPFLSVQNYDGEGSGYYRIPRYAATDGEPMICDDGVRTRWKPSIHMPRWASRITLEITDVRAERLQSISEDDAEAEGAPLIYGPNAPTPKRQSFAALWQAINGAESWNADPWVWVVQFKVIKKNVDMVLAQRHAAA